MSRKQRLTVTLDPEVLDAVRRAVAEARPPMSVSEWVNRVLAEKTYDEEEDKARRLAGLREVIEAYEAEFGVITEEEAKAAWDEARAEADRQIEEFDRRAKTA